MQGLIYRLSALLQRVGELEKSIASEDLSSINSIAKQILTAQFDEFKEQIEDLKVRCQLTADCLTGAIRDVVPVFERNVAKYLETHTVTDLNKAKDSSTKMGLLRYNARHLTQVLNGSTGKQLEIAEKPTLTGKRYLILTKLIGEEFSFPTSYEDLMIKLDALIANEQDAKSFDEKWGYTKSRINEVIEKLHKEVGYDQVNFWVRKLSGEQSGEDYGLVHRYDDLGILKKAILHTTEFLANKIMKEEAKGLDHEAIFDKLYEIIGKPQVESPMAWMKENAFHYTQELKKAIQEVKFLSHNFDQFNNCRRNQPTPALFVDSVAETVTDQIDLGKEDEKEEAQECIVEMREFSQVLEQLDQLASHGVAITPDLREQIEKIIDESDLNQPVNYEVWNLGGQKQGDNWGEVHRYADLNILRQALIITVRRKLHELIAGEFDDEEDRNTFYAKMARLHFNHGKIPSNLDLVAYGKENILFFDPDKLTVAVETVEEQIEQR